MTAAESPEPSALEKAGYHAREAEKLLTRRPYSPGPEDITMAHAHAATGQLWLAIHERTHR